MNGDPLLSSEKRLPKPLGRIYAGSTVIAAVSAPIELKTCSIGFPLIARNGRQVYDLRVRFVNRSSERVAEIHFTSAIDNRAVDVVDAGAFDPNVEVAHRFRQLLGFSVVQPAPPTSCDISLVRFSDGSTWSPAVDRVQLPPPSAAP
jgi:hypothetical protein